MQALLLPVGGDSYAVHVGAVREVLVAPRVTPLPTAPLGFRSLINVRGEVVPLLDTAALLGLGILDDAPYVVLVDSSGGVAGLAVSARPTFVTLDGPASQSELPGTTGQYQAGGQVVVLVDPAALIQTAQEARHDR